MTFDASTLALVAAIGLAGGLLGGLLGLGGSVVIIPGLALALGRSTSQHVIQAAAMAANIAVAVPAAWRHQRMGAIRRDVFIRLLASASLAIVCGVLLSNRLDGVALRRLFAAFLVYVVAGELIKLVARAPDHVRGAERVTWPRAGFAGGAMGLAAGLLGIGGGAVGVPLMHRLCRLPLRDAIAASSAVMCLTATVGAALKTATLPSLGLNPVDACLIGAALAPTAMLGGWCGASLVHRAPTPAIRAVLAMLLALSAWRMAGL